MEKSKNKQLLRSRRASSRSGFSLIEIAVVMTLLIIAIGGLSSAVVSSVRLSRTNEQGSMADDAARQALAELRTVGFADIFASFNEDPGDDPGVAGSAPGPNFEVEGLSPWRDDADGMVGEIIFPTAPLGLGVALNEAAGVGNNEVAHQARLLGFPRDLNGDGDAQDLVQGNYLVLPVLIRIQWRGVAGRSFVELRSVISE